MQKKQIEIKKVKEKITFLKDETGLSIFLKPVKGFSSCVAVFATRYGSVDRCFKKKGEENFYTVPDGIAHYLEHKLFENKDGSITFELFAKEKALANAETSFDYTAYYFSSPAENFLASLKILLNFVQTPYFTDENVEKERGIIEQEIKMEEDNPHWNVFFNCLKAMYEKSAVNVKIAGSVSSIAKIDKDILYKCYESFYNLNNMALTLVGDFKEEQVLDLIKKELKQKEVIVVEKQFEKEPQEVVLNLKKIEMSVTLPVFCIGFKMVPEKKEELLKTKLGLKILCELLFGEGSSLYKEFYESGLVLGAQLEDMTIAGSNYLALILEGESKNPEEVMRKICQEIDCKKKEGLNEEDFMLVKKAIYKEEIEEFSTPEKMAGFLTDCFVQEVDFAEKLEIVANFKMLDLLQCLNKIDTKNSNLTVAMPIESGS